MKISSLILGAFLSAQALGLHFPQHQSTSSYLSYLKGQQQGITGDLDDIHTDITDTMSRVDNQNNIDEKIRLLEEAILRQKVSLSSASKSLIAPLNESSWVCQNLQGTSDQQLRNIAGDIVTSTSQLDNQINKLNSNDVAGANQLVIDSGMAETYGEQIEKALKTPGTYVNQLPTSYHTDFSVPNWISGGMTNEQINQLVDDLPGNVITCPKDNPFYNGHHCINCNNDTPYFNLKTNECQKCDNFDSNIHTCQSDFNGLNTDAGQNRLILPPGVTLDDVIKQQGDNLCPSDRPFYADGNCLSCHSPNTLFDYANKKCVSCPEDKTYIAEKFACLSSTVTVTNLAEGKDRMILPAGTTILMLQQKIDKIAQSSDIQECPVQKPYYNGEECIDCPDEYYSWQQKRCMKCTDGKVFDLFSHSCQHVSYYSNLGSDNWASTNPDGVIQRVQEASQVEGAKKCPIEQPFFDGSNCINCPKDNFFSFDGMKCSTCSDDTVFNYNMHSCVKPNNNYQTNIKTSPNLIYGGKPKNEWQIIYDQNAQNYPSIADCPQKTPYFDGIICIDCPEQKPYFNLDYKICQKCQDGSQYDPDIHQCLSDEGNIVRQAPNIEKMAASIFA